MTSTQKQVVLELIQAHPEGIRTEWVKILAMRQGVSCSDRYIRYLAQEGLIQGVREEGNRTKTWRIVKQDLCYTPKTQTAGVSFPQDLGEQVEGGYLPTAKGVEAREMAFLGDFEQGELF